MNFVADTHAVIWRMMASSRLSPKAKDCFDSSEKGEGVIYLSAITLIEIIYLTESGRLPPLVWASFRKMMSGDLSNHSYQIVEIGYDIALSLEEVPYHAVPEMPDRIIAATAYHLGLPLITKDRRLQEWKGVTAIW